MQLSIQGAHQLQSKGLQDCWALGLRVLKSTGPELWALEVRAVRVEFEAEEPSYSFNPK